MKLIIINGSPRGIKSNSAVLINQFLEGFNSTSKHIAEVLFLAKSSDRLKIREKIEESDTVLLIFPLYTDCMPGIVLQFFEEIISTDYLNGKKLGFIVQSGFPEATQSVYVERYLEKFAKRNKANYLGTVIKGGVEGIQVQPASMTKKLFENFRLLGEKFAETNSFDPIIKARLLHRFEFKGASLASLKIISKTGILNMYWNSQLKKNNAYYLKNAQPYKV
jgi:multimeric flavodoxin WrbA